MLLTIGKRSFPVASLADASIRYQQFRGTKSRTRCPEGLVMNEASEVVAKVSYNGRVWAPGPWTPGQQPMLEAIVESREFQTSRAVQMESERDALAAKLAEKEAARVRIYNELIAYQHERDRLAGIADRASKILDEAAARKALDAKDTQ